MNNRPIGVFDSGLGGLTTLAECRKILPCEDFIYLADSNNLPYGTKSDALIKERVFACVQALSKAGAKAVVVACNTATNAGIKDLRSFYGYPFVGLEPAIKPAYEHSNEGNVLLLCTQATAEGYKLAELMQKMQAKNILVSPQKDLARLIEDCLTGNADRACEILKLYESGKLKALEKIRAYIEKILLEYKDVSAIVLGCTHYVFIKSIIRDITKSDIKIYDGNKGAAKRLKFLLQENGLLYKGEKNGAVTFLPPL